MNLLNRLALDAQYHAKRTGAASRRGNGPVRSPRGRVLAPDWQAYGFILLSAGVLVRRKVGGIVRYLPPPPSPAYDILRKNRVPYRHASYRL